MARLSFDIETDGLMPHQTKEQPGSRVWCITTYDIDTCEARRYHDDPELPRDGTINDGIVAVWDAACLVGHNIAGFDIPYLERYSGLGYPIHEREIVDTQLVAQLVFPGDTVLGFSLSLQRAAGPALAEQRMPTPLLRRHSLESWGYRIGHRKGEYLKSMDGAPKGLTQELVDYCGLDSQLSAELLSWLLNRKTPTGARRGWKGPHPKQWTTVTWKAAVRDSKVGYLVQRMVASGVGFDVLAAEDLYLALTKRRTQLAQTLAAGVRPWWEPKGYDDQGYPKVFVPKRDNRTLGYGKGCECVPVQLVTFNPASRSHVSRHLKAHGWTPTSYGADGIPNVTEDVLSEVTHLPLVPELLEYAIVDKRIKAIGEGGKRESDYLSNVRFNEDGVPTIHGGVNVVGTRTSRCSHYRPNLGNVVSKPKPYWAEVRALFRPSEPGWVQVGSDASGLEGRCLAHRLYFWDEGTFRDELLMGDIHEENRKAMGLFTRLEAKRIFYARIYGAQAARVGEYVIKDQRAAIAEGLCTDKPFVPGQAEALGEAAIAGLERRIVGLGHLAKACATRWRRGYIIGLDGRIIPCSSQHGAVNDLLQSDGAIIMKEATIVRDRMLAEAGLNVGGDWAPMLFVHDEWQDQAHPDVAETVGRISVEAIRIAGENLGLTCPLTGEYRVGRNWSETH